MLNLDNKELEYIGSLVWADVFEIWRETEAGNPSWEALYKERGYKSWEEWRSAYAEPLKPETKDWHLYRITEPIKTVPQFLGGPIKSWQEKFYGGEESLTFAQLAENPEIQSHGYVKQLMADFPQNTTLTGLHTPKGVAIIEGMHRCSALALAALQGKKMGGKVFIALAEFSEQDLPILTTRKN